MPTYQYVCDACDHDFEEFQYFSEDPLTKCPKCSKKKLRRLFGTGSSIIFKGSGFYETDYRSESYKAGAKADAEAQKPAGDAKSDANTESQNVAKPAGAKGTKAKVGKSDSATPGK